MHGQSSSATQIADNCARQQETELGNQENITPSLSVPQPLRSSAVSYFSEVSYDTSQTKVSIPGIIRAIRRKWNADTI